jgi:hypothetical protein
METPNTPTGFFRRLMSWRGALFLLAALVTIVALLVAEENWRGNWAWHKYKHDMEAKGERFDIARLIPPQVPDSQNLATILYFTNTNENADPYVWLTNQPKARDVKQPSSWRYGRAADLTSLVPSDSPAQSAAIILETLRQHEPVLGELESAGQRPYCQFNIPYTNWDNSNVFNAVSEHFRKSKALLSLLSLDAKAEMVSGHTEKALNCIEIMFRIDDGLKDEPLLISQLVCFAGLSIILNPLAEGLAEHRWSDIQLQDLQEHLRKTDLLSSTVRSIYGERDICVNQFFDHGLLQTPNLLSGWIHLEQLNVNRAIQDTVIPRYNLATREINPSVNHTLDLAVEKLTNSSFFAASFIHHTIFVGSTLPVSGGAALHAAFAQTEVDLAQVSCALERFRLAEGRYPAKLDDLSPRFIAVLPHDIINGQPLHYRCTDNGRFILYSVGWNEKDDGGAVVLNKEHRQDKKQGDWVFQYPDAD